MNSHYDLKERVVLCLEKTDRLERELDNLSDEIDTFRMRADILDAEFDLTEAEEKEKRDLQDYVIPALEERREKEDARLREMFTLLQVFATKMEEA